MTTLFGSETNTPTAAGLFQITNPGIFGGSTTLGFDGNEVQANVNDSLTGTLFLQFWGGDLNAGNGLIFVDESEGNVGIGLTTGCTELHVEHSQFTDGGFSVQNEFNNTLWQMYVSQSTDDLRLLYRDEGVCGGSLSRGNFDAVTGAYSSVSDARLKQDIETLEQEDMVDILNSLRPTSYPSHSYH